MRPFNAFGPRQSARAIVPSIVTQCIAASHIQLGALHPTRDLNYVANTVDGFVAAAESDDALGQEINVGSGREISIGDLARLIARLMDKEIEIEVDDRRLRPQNSEVERLVADNTKAKALLGWTPQVTLEDGLRLTIAWVKANLEHFRIGEYTL